MKLSNNSTKTQGDGSAWFKKQVAAMGFADAGSDSNNNNLTKVRSLHSGNEEDDEGDNIHGSMTAHSTDIDPKTIRSPRKFRTYQRIQMQRQREASTRRSDSLGSSGTYMQ